jgi:UDP-GlcNAc3NAcA epimerase
LLFSPTKTGYDNLIDEGFMTDVKPPYSIDNPKVYHCGDIMYDNSLYFSKIAGQKSTIISDLGLKSGEFILSTIHRDNNTDIPERINEIFSGIDRVATGAGMPVIIPLHPRTKKILSTNLEAGLLDKLEHNDNIRIIDPVSFLDMIMLEKNTRLIMTDSGGVQKESYFFKKPCIILRPETEWTEIVEAGTAIIADARANSIVSAYNELIHKTDLSFPPLFGDGHAAKFICGEIVSSRQ